MQFLGSIYVQFSHVDVVMTIVGNIHRGFKAVRERISCTFTAVRRKIFVNIKKKKKKKKKKIQIKERERAVNS